MKRIIFFLIFLGSFHHISAQLPPGFIRERIVTGLNPTSMVLAPDGRIFITEKNGKVRIIRDDQLLDEPLLSLEVDDSNERGLGHIVLHPEFETNNFLYIFYTVPGVNHNRISRFTANGDKVIPGSERVVIDLDWTGGVHSGGSMVFGFDGNLYVGTGDGGEYWRGEDLGSTNGKILRMDDMGQPVPDNPWYDFHYLRANMVYAYGFRNPFTMTMNPLTGEIYANDVGSGKFEEVNKVEKGAFYGWPRVEGKQSGEKLPPEYKDPVFQYAHANDYCCIVGSAFYYPEEYQFPQSYTGRYFYSDYCTGKIRMLDVETGTDKGIFISDGDRVIDMLVTPQGAFYYLERKGIGDGSQEDNTSTNEGTLWKVSYTGQGTPFISRHPQSILATVGEVAVFDVNALGSNPLFYTWYLNGDEVAINNYPIFAFESASIEDDSSEVYVVVSNSFGFARSDTALLHVTTNHRPEPIIHDPKEGSKYKAGNTIVFSGSASDQEDGILSDSSLSWRIDFHHGSHSHPGMPWTTGISFGEWVIPTVGETSSDVWYRIYLESTDSKGLFKITYRDIFPELGNVEVDAIPQHLKINLDGVPTTTPFVIEGVEGINRYITAPKKQVMGDSIYFFEKWHDGSDEPNREIRTRQEDQFYEGEFRGIAKGRGYGLRGKYFNNIDFTGMPILTRIDSTINFQFLQQSPDPSLPADNFGIEWNGYIQPYKSGSYNFIVFVDDGIYLEIENDVIIHNEELGVHYETGTKYLEGGRLYPIKMKMFDAIYNAQVKLRWSSGDFGEEVIPASQLFPDDYLSDPFVYGLMSIQNISAHTLDFYVESYKESTLEISITTVSGQTIQFEKQTIHPGKNLLSIDINSLPSGLYFLTGIDRITGQKTVEKFVKVK